VPGGFAVRAGIDEHLARRLVLATGVVDELPAIPGLRERWGRTVFHWKKNLDLTTSPGGVSPAAEPLTT
jgi:thioredoxin reductase